MAIIVSAPTRPSVAIPESHHWYRSDGTPQYDSPLAKAKDGRTTTPTTLRHARKLLADTGTGLFPSVTTVAKQALPTSQQIINWLVDTAVACSLDVCEAWPGETREQLEARVADDFKARRTSQADRGTLIHAEVEKWFRGMGAPEDAAASLAVRDIQQWRDDIFLIGATGPECETPFASTLGWAGRCDMLLPNPDGTTWTLADLKCPNTKSWTRFRDALGKGHGPYDEYGIQLAAYRDGWAHPHPDMKCEPRVITRCVSILVDGGEDSETAGECIFYEWPDDVLAKFGRVFGRAFENWCETRGKGGYDPRPEPTDSKT